MNRPAAPSAFHAGIAWLAAPVAAGVAFSLYLIIHAHRANHGIDCFPLDDPWIHLTYARNLAFHHSFSYFPGDHPTAGSTSPLYTLLLALGFHVTRNEKLLSWVLGILFQAGFLVMAALWARKRLGSSLLAAAFVLVLGLDARLAILSVSGMETSLFLFVMAAAFWAWAESRAVWLGLALGLGVWTRPESLILAGVLVLVTLLGRTRSRRAGEKSQPRVMRWAIPFAALVLLYFVFNRLTGGTFFPNTMAAKHAAYQQSRWFFMTHGVREALLSSAFVVLTPLALIQIGAEGARALRRKRSNLLAEAGWVPALVLAYVVFLPYAHRFSRYLVPALPAIALLGLAALQGIGARLSARRVSAGVWHGVLLLVLVGAQLVHVPAAAEEFRYFCFYHYQRHERCGRWLHDNTPADAVIATHDVGAIAFYSERRVIDTVGLIQPEVVPHLNKPDYVDFLNRLLAREHVTYIAMLDSWMRWANMEVANQSPVWVADPNPEILSVYPWTPGLTLLVTEPVAALNREAVSRMKNGDFAGARDALKRSLSACPDNPASWYLLGAAMHALGDPDQARAAYRKSLDLYPDFEYARYSLGDQLADEGKTAEARAVLERLHERHPDFPGLPTLWERLNKTP